jgi:hypothetical protein
VGLLDDRVMAVGLVCGHGVEHARVGGGEEGVEPPGVEQRALSVRGVEVGDPTDDNRPGTCSAFSWVLKAVKSISATSAREIQRPVVWS